MSEFEPDLPLNMPFKYFCAPKKHRADEAETVPSPTRRGGAVTSARSEQGLVLPKQGVEAEGRPPGPG